MSFQCTRISKSLYKISPDVTSDDRTYVCKKLGITKVTISNYLNEKGTNNDLGIRILELLKDRIASREAKLKSLCPNS